MAEEGTRTKERKRPRSEAKAVASGEHVGSR